MPLSSPSQPPPATAPLLFHTSTPERHPLPGKADRHGEVVLNLKPPKASEDGGPADGGALPDGGAADAEDLKSPEGGSPKEQEGNATRKPRDKPKAAKGRGAVAPPPPPSGSVMEEITKKEAVSLTGCVVSMMSFYTPIIVCWSFGVDMAATTAFHTKWDLGSTGFSTLAWLMFATCQLQDEDGKAVGIEAVLSNTMGFAIYWLFLVINVAAHGRMSTKACSLLLLGFGIALSVCLYPVVFATTGQDTTSVETISFYAGAMLVLSQVLPLLTACSLFWPSVDAPQLQIKNKRKLIVFSRMYSFIVSLYWAMYCSFDISALQFSGRQCYRLCVVLLLVVCASDVCAEAPRYAPPVHQQ